VKGQWGFGRIALAIVIAATVFSPFGATRRADATAVALAPLAQQAANQDFTAGSTVVVSGTEGDGLRVRGAPSMTGELRAVLIEGAQVEVLGGPVAADGHRWYQVRYDNLGGTGWVAGTFLTARRSNVVAGAPPAAAPPAAAVAPAAAPPSTATSAGAPASTSAPAAADPVAAASQAQPAATTAGAPSAPATVVVPAVLVDPFAATAGPPADPAAATAGAPAGDPAPAVASAPAAPASPAATTAPPGGPVATTPGRYVRLGAYQSASPEYGMNVFIWGEANTTQRDLDMLRELGFTWQKTLFQWRGIEYRGKGQYDWGEADRVVQASTAAGIKVLARIDFPPEWSYSQRPCPANECIPDRFEDYADFIRVFTTRYGTGSPIGRVHAIEIWNEPNLAREWSNRTVNQAQAGDYVRMLKLAYEAAKSVDPQMTIITAGLTPTGTQNEAIAQPDDVYLQWMYDAGAAAYFDVLGAHGAGYRAPPSMGPDEVAADSTYGGHASFSFRRVEHLRDVMVRNGDQDKQVWLLEFGWTSDEVHPAYAWHRVTEEQKAEYIVGAYQWARQNWSPWIGVMALWNLAAPGWSRTNEEYWWAITEPDGRPRPAYQRILDARRSAVLP
jgi:hypothetical protein